MLVTRTYADSGVKDAHDDSVDNVAAAAMYSGDLLDSNAMGMTSKRSLDLFPRSNCGHERFYCSRRVFLIFLTFTNFVISLSGSSFARKDHPLFKCIT